MLRCFNQIQENLSFFFFSQSCNKVYLAYTVCQVLCQVSGIQRSIMYILDPFQPIGLVVLQLSILHYSNYHRTVMPRIIKTGLNRLSWVFFLVVFLYILLPVHLDFRSLEPKPRLLGFCFSHHALHVLDPAQLLESNRLSLFLVHLKDLYYLSSVAISYKSFILRLQVRSIQKLADCAQVIAHFCINK